MTTDSQGLVELKPCPFCGGRATDERLSGSAWFVEVDHAPDCHFADFERTEAEAIEAWNTRANELSRPAGEDVVAVARAIRGVVNDASEDEQMLSAITFISNRDDILARAALSSSPPPETALREAGLVFLEKFDKLFPADSQLHWLPGVALRVEIEALRAALGKAAGDEI